ncbi:MAG TPA: AAA family ATPase [Blastocatellia bacterium]|nr:AAA family ATPase [Blastocatellia bacterium]
MNGSLTFVLLTAGRESDQELQAVVAADRRLRVVAASDNTEQVYAETIRWRPSAVILALGNNPRTAWDLSRRIHSASPETLIICAAQDPTPEMILESLRAGACEFLRLPIITNEFNTVLQRVELFGASNAKPLKKNGRILAIYSGKGGCGTSYIAANLAATLEGTTVLVDLDLRAGDQDVFFGVKPKFSIHDLVVNRARLDDTLLASFLTPLTSNLWLLAAPREVEVAQDIRGEHLRELLQLLRERYDHVVLDVSSNLDALAIAALDQADEIVLVFTLDLLAARSAQRALTIFDRLGYPRNKVKLVANRWVKKGSIEAERVEKFLGEKIACYIANDYPLAIDSINQGQPTVRLAPHSPLSQDMRKLAGVCGISFTEAEGAGRKGLFGSLFRRQSSSPPIEAAVVPDKA